MSILEAAKRGDLEEIEARIRRDGEGVDMRDASGATPLHAALLYGHEEVADALLDLGADVSAATDTGMVPLHACCYGGTPRLLERLITLGGDLSATDHTGSTVLHYAAVGRCAPMIDALTSHGIDVNRTNAYGETAAHRAAQAGRLGAVQRLAANGAVIDRADRFGLTPAHKAGVGGATPILAWLGAHGVPLDARDRIGSVPLHCAAAFDRVDSVEFLLDGGHAVDVRNAAGQTPLHQAIAAGARGTVELLLARGADPHATDELNRGALHWAALAGHADGVRRLLQREVRQDAETALGATPWELATYYGRVQAEQALREGKSPDLHGDFAVRGNPVPPLRPGDAFVVYLGHSGWAIFTANSVLIFDYVPAEPCCESSLRNGTVTDDVFEGRRGVVFVSHLHDDHYAPEMLAAFAPIPALDIVLGERAQRVPSTVTWAEGRTHRVLGPDLEWWSVPSTDAGVAWGVRADGVTLVHAGDHVNRTAVLEDAYTAEIQWLRKQIGRPDIVFLPVFGCGFPSDAGVSIGNRYSLSVLEPRIVFPMHVGWTSFFYRRFAEEAVRWGSSSRIIPVDAPGDRFTIRSGSVERDLRG